MSESSLRRAWKRRLGLMIRASVVPTVLVALAPAADATSLLEAWQAAQVHDRVLAVARSEHAAAQTRRAQASALWRPSVSISGGVGVASAQTKMNGAQFSAPGMGTSSGVDFATSINGGASARLAITAQQPLFDRSRETQREQLTLTADMGEVAWHAAQQEAMLRTAERYFDLAVARERVRVVQRQHEAVVRAAQEAHDRFKLGDLPVTDTHEADAALASLQAQLAAAELDAAVKRQALSDSTALAQPGARLPPPGIAEVMQPMEHWLQAVEAGNVQLRLAQHAVQLARQGLRQYQGLAGTSVNLVAQAGHDVLTGSGNYGRASNRASNAMVGVQVVIPLYTGGMRTAQEKGAAHMLEKALAQHDAAREQVAAQARAAWLGLQAGQSRVVALEQALKASHARLDATRVGQSVGDRTTLDVLNAENEYASAALLLAEARSAQVMTRLRLAALADELDEVLIARLGASAP